MTHPATPGRGQLVQVARWPRMRVQLLGEQRAAVDVEGSVSTVQARSVRGVRAGVVARCARLAQELRRPVLLEAIEPGASWSVAVTAEGATYELDEQGSMDSAAGELVFAGPCWACGSDQLVTATFCTGCGVAGPVLPDVEDVVAGIWLTFLAQDPVQVGSGGVVLGRRPDPVGGRRPVAVTSPGREVSRTHAAVDVDPAGWVLVTDLDSGNGVGIAHTGERLTPGVATAVPVGATLVLGDVLCTVAVRAAVAL